jgi:hypothetical protein
MPHSRILSWTHRHRLVYTSECFNTCFKIHHSLEEHLQILAPDSQSGRHEVTLETITTMASLRRRNSGWTGGAERDAIQAHSFG